MGNFADKIFDGCGCVGEEQNFDINKNTNDGQYIISNEDEMREFMEYKEEMKRKQKKKKKKRKKHKKRRKKKRHKRYDNSDIDSSISDDNLLTDASNHDITTQNINNNIDEVTRINTNIGTNNQKDDIDPFNYFTKQDSFESSNIPPLGSATGNGTIIINDDITVENNEISNIDIKENNPYDSLQAFPQWVKMPALSDYDSFMAEHSPTKKSKANSLISEPTPRPSNYEVTINGGQNLISPNDTSTGRVFLPLKPTKSQSVDIGNTLISEAYSANITPIPRANSVDLNTPAEPITTITKDSSRYHHTSITYTQFGIIDPDATKPELNQLLNVSSSSSENYTEQELQEINTFKKKQKLKETGRDSELIKAQNEWNIESIHKETNEIKKHLQKISTPKNPKSNTDTNIIYYQDSIISDNDTNSPKFIKQNTIYTTDITSDIQ
mmetsp:Transcript_96848/g.118648  ORF Transcript_96848/g.118648 Transcript_96848/m.118648 type:complete len:440 (-) Transcript_96848:37-1356(-)